jgi:FixJ family two-component response regulator
MVGAGNTAGAPLAYVLDDETAVATMICKQLAMLGMEAWQFSDPAKFFASLKVSRSKKLGARGGCLCCPRFRSLFAPPI